MATGRSVRSNSKGIYSFQAIGESAAGPHSHRVMPEQSNDYRIVVFGAASVGKSSLVQRFIRGTFKDNYVPTIEDTYRQVINCNKQVCTLQIIDTTGSHQFPAMQRLNISKGHAFILVYSIVTRQSLFELKAIVDEIREIKNAAGPAEPFPMMLVGNKCDESARDVGASAGEKYAKDWRCGFMETSAKTNHNVTELFQELLNLETRRDISLTVDSKKSKAKKKEELKRKKEEAKRKKQEAKNQKKKLDPKAKKKEDAKGKKVDPKAKKDDPKGKKDDPKAKKDDPKGKKDDPKGKKDDPKGKKDDPKAKKDDPKAKKDDPKGKKDDPKGKKDDAAANAEKGKCSVM